MTSTTTVELDGTVTVEYWPLDEARAYLWEQVKARRGAALAGGADTPKGRVDTTSASRLNISEQSARADRAKQAEQPFSINWTMEDNASVTHDADEMISLGEAVSAHVAEVYAVAQTLRELIYSAAITQTQQLDIIDIEGAPWPE